VAAGDELGRAVGRLQLCQRIVSDVARCVSNVVGITPGSVNDAPQLLGPSIMSMCFHAELPRASTAALTIHGVTQGCLPHPTILAPSGSPASCNRGVQLEAGKSVARGQRDSHERSRHQLPVVTVDAPRSSLTDARGQAAVNLSSTDQRI